MANDPARRGAERSGKQSRASGSRRSGPESEPLFPPRRTPQDLDKGRSRSRVRDRGAGKSRDRGSDRGSDRGRGKGRGRGRDQDRGRGRGRRGKRGAPVGPPPLAPADHQRRLIAMAIDLFILLTLGGIIGGVVVGKFYGKKMRKPLQDAVKKVRDFVVPPTPSPSPSPEAVTAPEAVESPTPAAAASPEASPKTSPGASPSAAAGESEKKTAQGRPKWQKTAAKHFRRTDIYIRKQTGKVLALLVGTAFVLLTALMELLLGMSFGKAFTGLRICRKNGRPSGIVQRFFRLFFKGFILIGFLLVMGKGRRAFHDYLTGTAVWTKPAMQRAAAEAAGDEDEDEEDD